MHQNLDIAQITSGTRREQHLLTRKKTFVGWSYCEQFKKYSTKSSTLILHSSWQDKESYLHDYDNYHNTQTRKSWHLPFTLSLAASEAANFWIMQKTRVPPQTQTQCSNLSGLRMRHPSCTLCIRLHVDLLFYPPLDSRLYQILKLAARSRHRTWLEVVHCFSDSSNFHRRENFMSNFFTSWLYCKQY